MDASDVLTNDVRLHVLRTAMATGRVPRVAETATALGRPLDQVAAAHRRLAEGHVYVLEPGSDELRMANPFSAVETPFRVRVAGRGPLYHGNCIWDGLGIIAVLGATDARLETHCPDCRAPLAVEVRGGALASTEGVAHFAVPARRWWDDIIHT